MDARETGAPHYQARPACNKWHVTSRFGELTKNESDFPRTFSKPDERVLVVHLPVHGGCPATHHVKGGTMRRIFRAALFVVFALVMATLRVTPASADTLTDITVNRALAAVGQPALTEVDRDGSITIGGVTITGSGETVARTTETGAQVLTVLRKGSEARYKFDLPAGAQLTEAPGGALAIVKLDGDVGGKTLGLIEAPWAVDAAGKALPTEYTIKGSTLVQSIDTTGATYPVVADPQVTNGFDFPFGPIWMVKFSKGDVNWIVGGRTGWAAGALMVIICAAISGPAAVACGLIGSFYAVSFSNMFKAAYNRNPNNCVYMKFTYGGLPLEWYRYNCDGSTY